MNIKALIRYCLVVVAFVLLLPSCTKEDLSVCISQLTIRYSYAFPQTSDAQFPVPVKMVRLFVFDNISRLFVTEIEKSVPEESAYQSFVLTYDIKPGVYSLVAWAGEKHPQLQTAVSGSHLVAPGTFVPGVTTLDQAILMLGDAVPSARTSLPAVISDTPIHLYHGTIGRIEVEVDKEQHAEIDLACSSHDVLVHITDLRSKGADVSSCEVSASLDNNMLTFRNEHPSMAQTVGYYPYKLWDEHPNKRSSALSVMRMRVDMPGDLVVTDKRNETELFRKPLVNEIIARHPHVSVNPSDNLGKYSKYEIDLEITDGGVIISITIAGWKVRLVDTDL